MYYLLNFSPILEEIFIISKYKSSASTCTYTSFHRFLNITCITWFAPGNVGILMTVFITIRLNGVIIIVNITHR